MSAGLQSLRTSSDAAGELPARYAVLHGRETVIEGFASTIATAERHVDVIVSHNNPSFYERVRPMFDALAKRAHAMVKVRLLLTTHPSQDPIAIALGTIPNVEIRRKDLCGLMAVVVSDGARMVQVLAADPTGRMASDRLSAVSTDASSMVQVHAALFDDGWNAAASGMQGTTIRDESAPPPPRRERTSPLEWPV